MDFLEEHSYVRTKQIKSEPEKTELLLTEINVKMECEDYRSNNDSYNTQSVNPLAEVEINRIECEDEENILSATLQKKTDLDFRSTVESSEDESTTESALNLSGLKKACILQTCLNLLDSSSSDEDELMLLWLLCSKRKKKLRRRRKV